MILKTEQLFAAGYAACFESALNLIIKQTKVKTSETSVTAKVSIGQSENGGFGLSVELDLIFPIRPLKKRSNW